MRRLVVISGKSKFIATFAAIVFSLTSIHLAAKAHIASLQREQEQLERSAISSHRCSAKTHKLQQASRQRRPRQARQPSIQKLTAPRPRQKKPSCTSSHRHTPAHPQAPDHHQHCGPSTGGHRPWPGLKDLSHRRWRARHAKSRRRFCDHQSRQRSRLSARR